MPLQDSMTRLEGSDRGTYGYPVNSGKLTCINSIQIDAPTIKLVACIRISRMENSSILDVTRLLEPACYPHETRDIHLISTHISWVILTGEFAYKIKRPVSFGFLDYSSLEQRHHFCRMEVSLNQKLGSDLYLEVVPITQSHNGLSVNGKGQIVEYAVKMCQFDERDNFTFLAKQNLLKEKHIDNLATTLARLHSHADRAIDQSDIAGRELTSIWITDTLKQLKELSPGHQSLMETVAQTETLLANHTDLIESRYHNGLIRDCHGDLHLGNIIWRNQRTQLFDRIEFNEELRWVDVMNDLAFPFMDLLHTGHHDLAWRLINRYLDETGDYEGIQLLPLFTSYRSLVRIKIMLLDQSSNDVDHNIQSHLRILEPLFGNSSTKLYITHGLSGSGKTTVARQLAQNEHLIIIRSDVLRNSGIDQGDYEKNTAFQYTAENRDAVYERMLALASRLLDEKISLILDATFLKHSQRNKFRKLATAAKAIFKIIVCQADRKLLEQRIRNRRIEGDASEANVDTLTSQIQELEGLSTSEQSLIFADTNTHSQERRLGD